MIPNSEWLESLYQTYLDQPELLDSSWKEFFKEFNKDKSQPKAVSQDRSILDLIEAYRKDGHLFAKINPIQMKESLFPFQLELQQFDCNEGDLSKTFPSYGLLAEKTGTLKQIVDRLQELYCNSIGFEFKHLKNSNLVAWIQNEIENNGFNKNLDESVQKRILNNLIRAESFEAFLHMKYVGQKRFSIEGAETLIPMLALLIERGAENDLEEVVLGMTHRGRLNVLAHILNKSYKEILSEFEEHDIPDYIEGTGDVKYHKGYTSHIKIGPLNKQVKITLTNNPSHLESVDPVTEGQARAKQFLKGDKERKKVIPLLLHGDAGIAGQGMVYETLQLSQLKGYETGGTIHFIINNQIGFTTIPRDLQSTLYCTDIAKAFDIPVFHVNAEDPEACVFAALMALKIRNQFHCDVFIDLNCYRKYGHNEGDEPAFTQPLEYKKIRSKQTIAQHYEGKLTDEKVIDASFKSGISTEVKKDLDEAFAFAEKQPTLNDPQPQKLSHQNIQTAVPKDALKQVAQLFCQTPNGFNIHPKIQNLLQERLKMANEEKPLDWGMAETFAYASLLTEGFSVRISGQDCCRGTFSHRHAIWVDQTIEKDYFPLQHLSSNQGQFEIINSTLSEAGILGFEYGYSIADTKDLTIWEAQFGDFANGAQVIIDQYIASAEQKWGQISGLVLYLPHGYEGQGPEHSSGRLERFLTLAAQDNIQVVYPTTPSQIFHLLRRQILRTIKKPLIVFTPKALLRLPECVSTLDELASGSFQEIIDDEDYSNSEQILLCSGHLYYDLVKERQNRSANCAIIRIEQLYPLDFEKLKIIKQKYSNAKKWKWVQEEPLNMGAWLTINSYIEEIFPNLTCVSRVRSASPATGSHQRHDKEQIKLLNEAFT